MRISGGLLLAHQMLACKQVFLKGDERCINRLAARLTMSVKLICLTKPLRTYTTKKMSAFESMGVKTMTFFSMLRWGCFEVWEVEAYVPDGPSCEFTVSYRRFMSQFQGLALAVVLSLRRTGSLVGQEAPPHFFPRSECFAVWTVIADGPRSDPV